MIGKNFYEIIYTDKTLGVIDGVRSVTPILFLQEDCLEQWRCSSSCICMIIIIVIIVIVIISIIIIVLIIITIST